MKTGDISPPVNKNFELCRTAFHKSVGLEIARSDLHINLS